MRNILTFILLFISITQLQAQTEQEDTLSFPETMQSDMDSLYWDWISKNYIHIDDNCRTLPEGPVVSDSIYIDRLSRIPSIIEMPFNDVVNIKASAEETVLREVVYV